MIRREGGDVLMSRNTRLRRLEDQASAQRSSWTLTRDRELFAICTRLAALPPGILVPAAREYVEDQLQVLRLGGHHASAAEIDAVVAKLAAHPGRLSLEEIVAAINQIVEKAEPENGWTSEATSE